MKYAHVRFVHTYEWAVGLFVIDDMGNSVIPDGNLLLWSVLSDWEYE